MLGAVAGDIIGSVYETIGTKRKDFRLFPTFSTFTDDTILTVAVADAILSARPYGKVIKEYARSYPLRGYGPRFLLWAASPMEKAYGSYGNGCAMRVSAIGHAFSTEKEVLEEAGKSAECTHDHPEGIKGAQAVALAVFMAKTGGAKEDIRKAISEQFGYNLSRSIEEIRPHYSSDTTCQKSVPEAICAFLDSASYEDAVRNAVSLGGDADTQAAIAGSIAEAYYKSIPDPIVETVKKKLAGKLWTTVRTFYEKHGIPGVLDKMKALDQPAAATTP